MQNVENECFFMGQINISRIILHTQISLKVIVTQANICTFYNIV